MAIAIIQARMKSERLPGKALLELGGRPVLAWVVRAALESDAFDEVVVATSDNPADDPIVQMASELEVSSYRGDHEDVLARFMGVVETREAAVISRMTADCPLLDPKLISFVVQTFQIADVDYLSTITPPSLPRGLDVEVFSMDALRCASENARGADRVHVTSHIYTRPDRFRIAGLTFLPDSTDLRLTLDTEDDLAVLRAIVAEMGDNPHDYMRVIEFLRQHTEIASMNMHVRQKAINEG